MKKDAFVLILAFAIALTGATVLYACDRPPASSVETGYAVAGIVTCDGNPVEGVSVLVNGEPVTKTQRDGIYSLTGLVYNDVVGFFAEGYTFSPDYYKVTGTAYDMNVTAKLSSPAEEPPEEGENPPDPDDEGETPPEEGDEGYEEPVPPATLSVPEIFGIIRDNGKTVLAFSVDKEADAFGVSAQSSDAQGFAQAALPAAGETGSLCFDGKEAEFYAELSADGTLVVFANMSDLFTDECTVTVSVFAADVASESSPFALSLCTPRPSVGNLVCTDGILSWSAENLARDALFVVSVNGVRVVTTSETEADVSAFLPDTECVLRVTAYESGALAALSERLSLSPPF